MNVLSPLYQKGITYSRSGAHLRPAYGHVRQLGGASACLVADRTMNPEEFESRQTGSFDLRLPSERISGPEKRLGEFFHGLELRLSEGLGFLHDWPRRIYRWRKEVLIYEQSAGILFLSTGKGY